MQRLLDHWSDTAWQEFSGVESPPKIRLTQKDLDRLTKLHKKQIREQQRLSDSFEERCRKAGLNRRQLRKARLMRLLLPALLGVPSGLVLLFYTGSSKRPCFRAFGRAALLAQSGHSSV